MLETELYVAYDAEILILVTDQTPGLIIRYELDFVDSFFTKSMKISARQKFLVSQYLVFDNYPIVFNLVGRSMKESLCQSVHQFVFGFFFCLHYFSIIKAPISMKPHCVSAELLQ